MKLRNIIRYFIGALIIAFIYIILTEDISLTSLVIGIILGFSAIFVCILFFGNDFIKRYRVKLLPLIWYFINLILIIIISGIKSLLISLSKDTTSLLIIYKSSLRSDMLITLLANSITLTPGTVTVDKNDNILKVMRLCKNGCENDFSDIKRLEDMISKAERGIA